MAPVLVAGSVREMIELGFNTLAATATSSPSAKLAAYMRVSAMTLAAYDWLITLNAEFLLYRQHRALSKAVVLFFLVRYVSIAAMVTSNIGFFGKGFSVHTCERYHLVAPLLKMLATLISQIIISIRTYAISRKARWVLWTLSTLFIASCVPEVLGNSWQRKAVRNAVHNCTSGNLPKHKVAWLHYLAAVGFDTIAMGIATFYLYIPNRTTITGLAKAMLEEGILYFVCLTCANLVNLVMFLNPDITAQSSAAVFGQAVTMIMSQRIILSLQKWFSEPTHGHSSRSRSAPDYAMHVLGNTAGGARGTGTGAGLGTGSGAHSQTTLPSKSNNAWSEPGNKGTRSTGWEGLKATQHVRQASSGIFNVGTENVAELHVVVEREVRYDHDAISESEKSLADVKK